MAEAHLSIYPGDRWKTAKEVRPHFSMRGRTCKDKGLGGFRKACFHLKPEVTGSSPYCCGKKHLMGTRKVRVRGWPSELLS